MIKRTLKKKIAMLLSTTSILSLTTGINVGAIKAYAAGLPGAHHSTVGDDVFLGGNFMEIGVNKHGSLGTYSDAPTGFHPPSARTNLGMVTDGDGFDVGKASNTGDFFCLELPLKPM